MFYIMYPDLGNVFMAAVVTNLAPIFNFQAVLHNETGSSVMAQKYVRDAIAIDPCKPSLW